MEQKAKKRRRVLSSSAWAAPLDIEEEIAALKKVTERICASKESARAFLVKSGLYTEDGKLAERYR